MILLNRRSLLLGAAAAAGLGACATLRLAGAPATPLPPLPLPEDAPLISQGGLLLNRHVIGFGGISALHVDDALTLTAISDLGHWMQAGLEIDAGGRPRGLQALRTGRLDTGFPLHLPGVSRDAESLARTPEGGWLVGFERWHRIVAYDRLDGPGRLVEKAPPGLGAQPNNAGLESLAVLADGRWWAVSEGLWQDEGTLRAWLGRPGGWTLLRYRPARGFVPTDAAPLPDGGVLMVERRFSLRTPGFSGQLRRIPAAQLASATAESVIEPETLLPAAALPHENWEGVSAFHHAGRPWIAMVADDNEMFFQKGLLHLFTLRAAPEALSGRRTAPGAASAG
ncbi:esterase-like activity of phytase family protein [Pseudoroseomonas sp. WGS1072]|uniref:esterase-like activity of phytase family protein n=1 Tax=Roseomonas sp. WGS1072 TaxID=3366816 RepID=UPI003BF00DA9